jgi:hypothetical protein
MSGNDEATGSLFSHSDVQDRIPARHPLRKVREIVNDALACMDADFDRCQEDRPSITPERCCERARKFLAALLAHARVAPLLSDGTSRSTAR